MWTPLTLLPLLAHSATSSVSVPAHYGSFISIAATTATPTPDSSPEQTPQSTETASNPESGQDSSESLPPTQETSPSPSPSTQQFGTIENPSVVVLDSPQFLGITTGLVLIVLLLAALVAAQMRRP